MFSFKALELMNWDLWDHVRVPLDEQVVMIAGPNGSGKTTFLDALRVLLGARSLSTARKLGSYIRGNTKVVVIKGVVNNPLRKGFGRRPFTHRGVFDDEATLACIIQKKGGNWQRRYAILPGDASLEAIRAHDKLLSPDEYSRDLEKAHLPRTLLKILALEQGETNKLCKRSPNQLLEYVLEMQGDKEVMDNYSTARESYMMSGRELREQENKTLEMRRHLQALERDAKSFVRFQEMSAELVDVRDYRLPATRYRQSVEALEQLDEQIEEAKDEITRETGAIALQNIRWNIVSQKIAKAEDIKVTSEEISRAVIMNAQQTGADVQAVIKELQENQQMQLAVRDDLLQSKVIMFLAEHATITEVDPPEPTEDEHSHGHSHG